MELPSLQVHRLTGYPSLAALVASDPDRTTAIFKRYDRLAARNLLYFQSELAELQAQQDEYDKQDFFERGTDSNGLVAKQCARNWEDFKVHSKSDNRQQERMELAMRIRKAMKDYREAILFEVELSKLPKPSKKTLEAFRSRYYNGLEDESFPTLGGHSSGLYDDIDDLSALKVEEHQDRLTTFARNHMGFLFTRSSDGMVGYSSDQSVATFVAFLSTLLAAILLIGAVVTLYLVTSPNLRLGLITTFTVVFAASVGLLTNARRAELFAATAAYAAVLVVFVSGDLGNQSSVGRNGNEVVV
ncbi:hypothetical protein BDY21DRAFT_404801 [Lineolata rhizophorae]|uniref:DUF6594 domain-containing protein n=1 Tax=Lineolata rhizophorae TaxID=578093 RepID=A0A6A6NN88_9PEZI|nr:hypothetical protein BDY21DRAFT_404801 [Lineolata rhizophorae]